MSLDLQEWVPFVRVSLFYFELSPWEESSEAFTIGVHLILLEFIRISLSTPKTFPPGRKEAKPLP